MLHPPVVEQLARVDARVVTSSKSIEPRRALFGGGRAMTRRRDPAWIWMIGAFGGALALAGAVLADLPLTLGDGDGS